MVVVGSPEGCLVYTHMDWEKPKSVDLAVDKQTVIDFITKEVS